LSRFAAVLIAALDLLKLVKYMLNFSSFSRAALAHSASAASFARIASKCCKPSASDAGASTGLGSALSSFRCRKALNASRAVLSSSGVMVELEEIASSRR
jgi:hypothetical protein